VKLVKEGDLTDVRVAIDDGKVLSTHPMAHDHATKPKPAAPEKPEQADRKG